MRSLICSVALSAILFCDPASASFRSDLWRMPKSFSDAEFRSDWAGALAIAQDELRKCESQQTRPSECHAVILAVSSSATQGGNWKLGEEYADKAIRIAEEFLQDDIGRPISYVEKADNLMEQGRFRAAEEFYRTAIVDFERLTSPRDERRLSAYGEMARSLVKQGKIDEAVLWSRKRVDLTDQYKFTDDTSVALVYGAHASILNDAGKNKEAIPYLVKTILILSTNVGNNHVETVVARNNLGVALLATKDFAGAEIIFRGIQKTLRDQLGDRHPDVAVAAINLATVLTEKDELDEALELTSFAQTIFRRARLETHPQTIWGEVLLASIADRTPNDQDNATERWLAGLASARTAQSAIFARLASQSSASSATTSELQSFRPAFTLTVSLAWKLAK